MELLIIVVAFGFLVAMCTLASRAKNRHTRETIEIHRISQR
jgi:hypothetical protein